MNITTASHIHDRHTIPRVWDYGLPHMCTDNKYFLCVLVSTKLYSPNLRLTCAANLSIIVSGMHSPRANGTKLQLKFVERFPALAYGTLVAALAGWRGVQRYKDTRGSIARSNGNWLLDIFIRQVISIGRFMLRAR